MRPPAFQAVVAAFGLLFGQSLIAQSTTPPLRDPQALSVVQAAIASMGGRTPADSTGTGTIVITAGSKTETGNIRVLTRGNDQSVEEIQLSNEKRSVVYSHGKAIELLNEQSKTGSLELAASSHSLDFPLPQLTAAFDDQETAFQYVGAENIEGLNVHHIRFWKTYASQQKLMYLASFTRKDLWVDATTGLPKKLAFERREARGGIAPIRIEVLYSDWRNIKGVTYPHRLEKSWNGIPWMTITTNNVAFETGLSESDFQVTGATEAK